jgi:hypothetical protein
VNSDPSDSETREPDSSDVVTGPVGSASLRDPATSGPEGAELERLPIVESDEDVDAAKRPAPSPGG